MTPGRWIEGTAAADRDVATLAQESGEVRRTGADDAPWVGASWPTPLGLGKYGPTDGTAVGAVLIDCPTVTVRDRGAELTMTLSCS